MKALLQKKISVVLVSLLLLSVFGVIAPIQTVQAQTSDFTVKSTHVNLDNIVPSTMFNGGRVSYISNWAQILHGLGVNTIRIIDGGQGSMGENIVTNPDEWATNLEAILKLIDSNGFKCYFQYMGDEFNCELGIQPSQGIEVSKATIDKLAGLNSLGYNFLNDPRILTWCPLNEFYFGAKNSDGSITTNYTYEWITAIMDYIRNGAYHNDPNQGGDITANCPILDARNFNGWDWWQEFSDTVPYFENHADYMEFHEYANGDYLHGASYSNSPSSSWTTWENYVYGILANQMAYRGSFPADHIILGEFGLWTGYITGKEGGTWTYTDQNVIDYYTHYFNALNRLGSITWVNYFCAFKSPAFDDYGKVTYPSGTLLAGNEVIAANYAGGSWPKPTATLSTSSSPLPTSDVKPSPPSFNWFTEVLAFANIGVAGFLWPLSPLRINTGVHIAGIATVIAAAYIAVEQLMVALFMVFVLMALFFKRRQGS